MSGLRFAPGSLLVSEIFGPTIQGEGRNAGVPAVFVRTAHCNVQCRWCDTGYSWDWRTYRPAEQITRLDLPDVWSQARALDGGGVQRLVISGGEPALQWPAVVGLAALAIDAGWKVELETSGSARLGPGADLFDVVTVSPKLANSGVPEARRRLDESIAAIAGQANVVAKFVIAIDADVDEAQALVAHYGFREVYLMPLAQTPQDLAEGIARLVPLAARTGYRVSPRIQVLCWPGQRAR